MTEDASLEWVDGAPRSRRFGDVYFSVVDGLAESRAVYLAGCGLPQAFEGRPRFVVGELGFGTGLNILALLDLWRSKRAPDARLSIFSIEAFPLERDEAARALAAWPELAELSALLLAQWPARRAGFHRIGFPQLGATLDLAVMDAAQALEAWQGRADAWFLDGFAPAKNPDMWSEAVLALVAARSAPGARAATFTVAGAVRRGLEAAGFGARKVPGFGRKKERLEAVLPGAPAAPARPRVAVVGAGIGGAALVRAFQSQGVTARLIDAGGRPASRNPAALVSPRLDAGGGGVARLHVQAFERAVALYRRDTPAAILATGAVQLEAGPRDPARFDRLAAWEGFAPGTASRLSADAVAEQLGEPAGPGGLLLADALTIAPAAVLEAWAGEAAPADVARLERGDRAWRLLDANGDLVLEAEVVCLAGGAHTARLTEGLPLRAVRGQVAWTVGGETGPAAAWGGYAIPAPQGVLFGATHDRDDWDETPREADDDRNRALLAKGRPELAAALADAPLKRRASLRAATPDHLPLAGAVDDGLYVLTGLGGRGFTLAPLLAEAVAAEAIGAPNPLPRDLAALVDPARYRSPPRGED